MANPTPRRRFLTRIAGLLLAALAAPAVSSQGGAGGGDHVFEHEFRAAGETTGPGFRVTFDRRGALVKRVVLLDQTETLGGTEPLALVTEEWVDPNDHARGYFGWLGLEEPGASRFTSVGDGIEISPWTVEREPNAVSFSLDCGDGLRLEKTFRYEAGRRDLVLELALRSANDHVHRGDDYPFLLVGLAVRSARSDYVFGANQARAVGLAVGPEGDEFVASPLDAAKDTSVAPPRVAVAPPGGHIAYAGSTNRYFAGVVLTDDPVAQRALVAVDTEFRPVVPLEGVDARSSPVCLYRLNLRVPDAGQETRARFRVYMGPKSYAVFDEQSAYQGFDSIVYADLEPPCCPVPGVQWMGSMLMQFLSWLQGFLVNWGLAIMVLTIVVRGCLVPLNFRMQKAMRAHGAKMAKLKPKIDAIQKRYANDQKQLQQEMLKLQKEHGLFPPIGGCLPMFVTIPIFVGLFTMLRVDYDLRHEGFVAWIDDLSRPDGLVQTGLSWFPEFNLLPIIMVGLWWWLQAGTPLPTDPQQRQMMKIMRYMPLLFGVMLYNYASGLMVYMITSSGFALVEQRITRRILGPVNPDSAAFGATPTI